MEQVSANELFTQLRTAHRLLAAYYQRLLATMEDIANKTNVNFYTWYPSEFARPPQLTTNIHSRWAWDLLPGMTTCYLYSNHTNSDFASVGEHLLAFHVVSDSGILTENTGPRTTEPDALNLSRSVEASCSVLRVRIVTPVKDTALNWHYQIWHSCKESALSDAQHPVVVKKEDRYLLVAGFEIPLAELLEEGAADKLAQTISTQKDTLIAKAAELSSNNADMQNNEG